MNSWARRAKLDTLLTETSFRCYWCGCRLVRLSSVHPDQIVVLRHHFVAWKLANGKSTQALIASVDHLNPASIGGPNTLDNLVPSCKWCNEERGREWHRQPGPPAPPPPPTPPPPAYQAVVLW